MLFVEFVSIISFQAVRGRTCDVTVDAISDMVEVPHEYSLGHLELASVLKICFS